MKNIIAQRHIQVSTLLIFAILGGIIVYRGTDWKIFVQSISRASAVTQNLAALGEAGSPSAPLVVGGIGISATQINVSWSNSTSTIQEASYNVYRDGVKIGSTPYLTDSDLWHTGNLYQDVGLSPNTSHTYYVTAVSSDGKESAASMSVTATTKDSSQTGLLPSNRRVDWTPGVTVGVPGGIPSWSNIIDVSESPYFVTGSSQTTTGSISNGSYTLTVSSPGDFIVGQTITVEDATTHIYDPNMIVDLYAKITAIDGNAFTLDTPAGTNATNVTVSHSDMTAVNRAIAEAPNDSVVYIPPGHYTGGIYIARSRVAVRGAGMDQTFVQGVGVRGGGGDGFYRQPYISVTGGATRGSTQITVADASSISVGSLLQITADNNLDLPEMTTTGYQRIRLQNLMVTAKSGNTITFNPPLMALSYTNPKITVSATLSSWVGIEDMTVDVSEVHAQVGVSMDTTYASWIKNVKIGGATNYTLGMGNGLFNEIRHVHLVAQATQNQSNHAGFLLGGTTGLLFEDNIVLQASPMMEINSGSAGNVFAYNYIRGGMVDSNHGPHNHNNLYEGNVMDGIMSDGYFGGESEQILFRNWITGAAFGAIGKRWSRNFSVIANQIGTDGSYQGSYSYGGPYMGNGYSDGFAAPTGGVYWKDWNPVTGPGIRGTVTSKNGSSGGVITLYTGQDRLVAYCGTSCLALGIQWGSEVAGASGGVVGTTLTVSTDRALPDVGTDVGVWPRSEGFPEMDLDVLTTLLLKVNHYSGISTTYLNEVNESLQPGETVPDSLFRTSKPDWFGSLAWPPVDYLSASTPNDDEIIPAGYRYHNNGDDPPGVTVSTTYSFSVTKTGSGTGVITSSPEGINCGSDCSESFIANGTTFTLEAASSQGSTFTGWSGGGCSGTSSCTVSTGSVVTANFRSDTEQSNQGPTQSPSPSPSSRSSGTRRSGGGGGSSISPRSSSSVTAQRMYPYKLITKNLAPLSIDPEVAYLHYFLLNQKFLTATTSKTFDTSTQRAVESFQRTYGLVFSGTPKTTGYGAVGPRTRAQINAIIAKGGGTTVTTPVAPVTSGAVSAAVFTRDLKMGSVGADVKALQQFLNAKGYTVSVSGPGAKGYETTYFGLKVRAALIRFQIANKITPASGVFGPLTRTRVNSMR